MLCFVVGCCCQSVSVGKVCCVHAVRSFSSAGDATFNTDNYISCHCKAHFFNDSFASICHQTGWLIGEMRAVITSNSESEQGMMHYIDISLTFAVYYTCIIYFWYYCIFALFFRFTQPEEHTKTKQTVVGLFKCQSQSFPVSGRFLE